MRNYYCLAIILFFLFSCESKKSPSDLMVINTDDFSIQNEVPLEKIASQIELIELKIPDSVVFGEISQIKVFDDYWFIHDQDQTASIIIVDSTGQFIGHLDKRGNDPESYSSLDAFTLGQDSKKVIVYSRSQELLLYKFPSLEFIDRISFPHYIMNLESVGGDIVIFKEGSTPNSDDFGLYKTDMNFEILEKIGESNNFMSIEASYPNTITRLSKNNILYSEPFSITTAYSISPADILPKFKIDFGSKKTDSKLWKNYDPAALESQVFSEKKYIWVQSLIIQNSTISFWWLDAGIMDYVLGVYDVKSGDGLIYKKVTSNITKGGEISRPKGIVDNQFYLSVLQGEEVNPEYKYQNRTFILKYSLK